MSSVRILQEGQADLLLSASPGDNILDLLRGAGITVYAPCGGKGRCGGCMVELDGQSVPACRSQIPGDCVIRLPELAVKTGSAQASGSLSAGQPVLAAVDLGTTTVAVRIVDESGQTLAEQGEWNCQAPYGADVISRTQYCIQHGTEELSRMIRRQVKKMVQQAAGAAVPERVFLAGNTIMQHIFCDFSPESIAHTPFEPLTRFEDRHPEQLDTIPICYAPCVSGYVGGDITAGLLVSGMNESDTLQLFADIGTNGEMAIGNRDGFICCAAASGPAFEGAGIQCGMPGISGAVSRVYLEEGMLRWDVIGSGKAEGICGSGLIDLIAVLLDLGIIDGSGRLQSPFDLEDESVLEQLGAARLEEDSNENGILFLTDTVYLTAADVRQLQLAKAAVAAGLQVLLNAAGTTWEDISRLNVAGGFGMHMNLKNAAKIGLLPAKLSDRTFSLGNTSLQGASAAVVSSAMQESLLLLQ
ncbi:MAG: ASKHA domain-containing protein, partial [Oscillospiraceae bacterium]|nr:ASKHA domain-containing protein [Oscillospiraceae bacterium]